MQVAVERKMMPGLVLAGVSRNYADVAFRLDFERHVLVSIPHRIAMHRICRHSERVSVKTISTLR